MHNEPLKRAKWSHHEYFEKLLPVEFFFISDEEANSFIPALPK
jgi:hypothetical protein